MIDGYPGSYGQILTNLSSTRNHASPTAVPGRSDLGKGPRQRRCRDHFCRQRGGMTPDVQRQAFDPFFTTRRNEGGTGLGLHIRL